MSRLPLAAPVVARRMAATRAASSPPPRLATRGHISGDMQRLRRSDDNVLAVVRRGVYACARSTTVPPVGSQHRMRVAALDLALTAPAVLSHQSAATELGLELLDPDLSLLHVTRAG